MRTIVDFGSRSIKIFISDCVGRGSQIASVNRCPLEEAPGESDVAAALDEVERQVRSDAGPVLAIGTAFARRSPRLRTLIEAFCSARGWRYETLTQAAELDLIARAFSSAATGRDIFNAGGGSIQIAAADGAHVLLDFGISDLNARFGLSRSVAERDVAACVSWLAEQMPRSRAAFVYTGGEATYLAAMGVHLGADGRCEAGAFEAMAARLARMEPDALERSSPFGRRWMTGAVASNCIVLAALRTRELAHFYASDANVADGLALAHAEDGRG
ncbi:hypothetical protein [Salinarimonas ramus]|uniref:Exopolyphosphatase, putative n=1 Tax=Salinarimonas ramus TaxID=690164 RepID=A0A917V3N9_9HYPH|nr:hypothetical protein [Salinarimonas ramus]GGK31712.1 exopolyphosphatase, putative [Salinarimonas ramus]